MKVLFTALTTRLRTGARYAESLAYQALSREHEVKLLCFEEGRLARLGKPGAVLFGYLPYLLRQKYDLIFTSDSFVFADLVYVQPPAGEDVRLPARDGMFCSPRFNRIYDLAQRPLGLFMARNTRFLANSLYTKELIKRFLRRKAEVIYPPVPLHLYPERPGEERENLVVTLSALNPRKNLKLIAEVAKLVPEARFVLAGYFYPQFGYLLEEIRAELEREGLSGNFIYLPSTSEAEKVKLLERAKVYFHPTICEPFGIGIAEGMAAGCIPVTHDSGGPREFVPKAWRYHDAAEAASKIRLALETWSPEMARELRLSVSCFSEERFQTQILTAVESLARRRPSPNPPPEDLRFSWRPRVMQV